MSHHIYQTEGIILGGFNVGESNRFLYVFTKDLGLLGASAQGVREFKSKLKYSLQDFSHIKIDLVRGKEVWRITSAEYRDCFKKVLAHSDKKRVFAKAASLLKRLCVGEGVHEGMFESIVRGLLFLEEDDFTKEELRMFEIILVLKILNYLGYWGESEKFAPFIEKKEWDKKILHEMLPFFTEALHEVNSALKESHL